MANSGSGQWGDNFTEMLKSRYTPPHFLNSGEASDKGPLALLWRDPQLGRAVLDMGVTDPWKPWDPHTLAHC